MNGVARTNSHSQLLNLRLIAAADDSVADVVELAGSAGGQQSVETIS